MWNWVKVYEPYNFDHAKLSSIERAPFHTPISNVFYEMLVLMQ